MLRKLIITLIVACSLDMPYAHADSAQQQYECELDQEAQNIRKENPSLNEEQAKEIAKKRYITQINEKIERQRYHNLKHEIDNNASLFFNDDPTLSAEEVIDRVIERIFPEQQHAFDAIKERHSTQLKEKVEQQRDFILKRLIFDAKNITHIMFDDITLNAEEVLDRVIKDATPKQQHAFRAIKVKERYVTLFKEKIEQEQYDRQIYLLDRIAWNILHDNPTLSTAAVIDRIAECATPQEQNALSIATTRYATRFKAWLEQLQYARLYEILSYWDIMYDNPTLSAQDVFDKALERLPKQFECIPAEQRYTLHKDLCLLKATAQRYITRFKADIERAQCSILIDQLDFITRDIFDDITLTVEAVIEKLEHGTSEQRHILDAIKERDVTELKEAIELWLYRALKKILDSLKVSFLEVICDDPMLCPEAIIDKTAKCAAPEAQSALSILTTRYATRLKADIEQCQHDLLSGSKCY